jgi:hypothetical protein
MFKYATFAEAYNQPHISCVVAEYGPQETK